MREMGYPPGYLGKCFVFYFITVYLVFFFDISMIFFFSFFCLDLEDEERSSGIIIYTDGDTKDENDESVIPSSTGPKRKMTVDFPGINAPIPVTADQNCWAAVNFKPTAFNSYSNNFPLNHKIESCPDLYFPGQSHKPQEVTPLMSDYASSYQHYAPTFPLLSNYAKSYLDHINQISSYAFQNSWSSFHS